MSSIRDRSKVSNGTWIGTVIASYGEWVWVVPERRCDGDQRRLLDRSPLTFMADTLTDLTPETSQ